MRAVISFFSIIASVGLARAYADPPTQADEPQAERQLRAQGYKPTMRNGEKLFCKREAPLGSRLQSALHCLTVAEAEMIAKEGRETAERIQRDTSGCLNRAAGGCGK